MVETEPGVDALKQKSTGLGSTVNDENTLRPCVAGCMAAPGGPATGDNHIIFRVQDMGSVQSIMTRPWGGAVGAVEDQP